VSRGIVLWPDGDTSGRIRDLWKRLSTRGLPSLETHTHRLHQPHCSLKVAEDLPVHDALAAVGVVPDRPIPLHAESVGVFPPGGALFLGCVVNQRLLGEHHRVHEAITPLAIRPWPFFEPDGWVPHITLAWSMSAEELATAIPLVMEQLPIRGTLDRGGIEDGATGESWPSDTT
jgi:2'-5' RNA ligase